MLGRSKARKKIYFIIFDSPSALTDFYIFINKNHKKKSAEVSGKRYTSSCTAGCQLRQEQPSEVCQGGK